VSEVRSNSKIRLNAEVLGEAENVPLLVLHGWGHSIANIREMAKLLARDRQVHMIDLPGHGKSDEPDDVWGMADFAQRIAVYLDDLGLAKVDILGHSFGGKTGIKFGAMFPQRLRRLVLLNSSGLMPKRSFKKRIRIFFINTLRRVLKQVDTTFSKKFFEEWFVPRFASPDYLNAGAIRKTFVRTVNEDLTEELRSLDCPTLLLWGELDTETPLDSGKRMQALIRGSELKVLDGKGHEPFVGAGAHLVAHALKPFLTIDTKSEVCNAS
jgi:pimeloyl-ACP methyl ester carboxylesterase